VDSLRGILAQGDVAFDLLICDDRSDDETLSLVQSEVGGRARIDVNPERLGLARNWNRCVTLSRTPLVTIFHQDDLMRPGHLAAHLKAFEAAPQAGLVASAVEMIDAQGRSLPGSVVESGGLGASDRRFAAGELLPSLAVSNPLRCSAVTLRAEAHQRLGGFDASYRYVVDWEFWLRIAREFEVCWLAKPTVAMRWHSASETHRFKKGTADLEETEQLIDQILAAGIPGPALKDLRRSADRRLSRAFLNRSHEALRAGNPVLARRCLDHSFSLSPAIVKTIARDPRLALQIGLLAIAPRLAASLLARPTFETKPVAK